MFGEAPALVGNRYFALTIEWKACIESMARTNKASLDRRMVRAIVTAMRWDPVVQVQALHFSRKVVGARVCAEERRRWRSFRYLEHSGEGSLPEVGFDVTRGGDRASSRVKRGEIDER